MTEQATPVERAAQLGWVPQEEFRGDPEKWVDAEVFLERGEHIMPILRENNKRLEGELARLNAQVKAAADSMEALKQYHAEDVRKNIEATRAALKAELKQAKTDGDVDAEMAVQERLEALPSKEALVRQPTPSGPDPELLAAMPWFGQDKKKSSLAVGIAQELREDPANAGLQGRAFYDAVLKGLEGYLNSGRKEDPPATSKVDGGGRSSGAGSGTTKKGFAALPADAKAACNERNSRMVGEGRAFKTDAAWQSYYAEQYFRDEEF